MSTMKFSAVPTTNTCAILSLVMAILGWNLLPIAGFVGAIILGRFAQRQLRNAEGSQTGHGLALAGVIIGWIGLIVAALLFAFVLPWLQGPITVNLPAAG